MMTIIK
jgi:hypothetical protein